MAVDPNLALSAVSTLAGLFGKGPQLPPEVRRLYNMQFDIANQLKGFAGSVPLSDPGEQAALAQMRGMLGEQQRAERGMFMGALGQPGQPQTNLADALTGLTQQQGGQMMGLNAQALLDALQQRRQALYGAAQTAQGALGAATQRQGGTDFSSILQNLGQLYGQMQARKQGMGGMKPGQQMGLYGRQAPNEAMQFQPNFTGGSPLPTFPQMPSLVPQPGPLTMPQPLDIMRRF